MTKSVETPAAPAARVVLHAAFIASVSPCVFPPWIKADPELNPYLLLSIKELKHKRNAR